MLLFFSEFLVIEFSFLGHFIWITLYKRFYTKKIAKIETRGHFGHLLTTVFNQKFHKDAFLSVQKFLEFGSVNFSTQPK